jgi:hypothetical protein
MRHGGVVNNAVNICTVQSEELKVVGVVGGRSQGAFSC